MTGCAPSALATATPRRPIGPGPVAPSRSPAPSPPTSVSPSIGVPAVTPSGASPSDVAMEGATELGGLVAGESVVVTGPGPIGLLGVAVAKALGASPVILTGTRDNRLKIGLELGADHVINAKNEDPVAAVRKLNGRKGGD